MLYLGKKNLHKKKAFQTATILKFDYYNKNLFTYASAWRVKIKSKKKPSHFSNSIFFIHNFSNKLCQIVRGYIVFGFNLVTGNLMTPIHLTNIHKGIKKSLYLYQGQIEGIHFCRKYNLNHLGYNVYKIWLKLWLLNHIPNFEVLNYVFSFSHRCIEEVMDWS